MITTRTGRGEEDIEFSVLRDERPAVHIAKVIGIDRELDAFVVSGHPESGTEVAQCMCEPFEIAPGRAQA